jgi:hypothetical protein
MNMPLIKYVTEKLSQMPSAASLQLFAVASR